MKKISDGKKCIICLALVIIMGVVVFYTYTADDNTNEHEGIVRLHVIANSDSDKDQSLKLKVRDAVLHYMKNQKDLTSATEVTAYIENNRKRLKKIAEGVIASEGYDYSAKVYLGVRYIPEKTYSDMTFPAGNYEALNVTIGEGKGENWWCVVFPPLCLLDEGTEDGMADNNTTDSDIISGNSEVGGEKEQLRLKWKLAELLE